MKTGIRLRKCRTFRNDHEAIERIVQFLLEKRPTQFTLRKIAKRYLTEAQRP